MEQSGIKPDALLHRPILTPDERFFWDAFQKLTGSRQWTQAGPTEIPYPTIILWLNENLISDPNDRDEFLDIIQQLDSAYLEYQYAKLKR